MPIKMIKTFPTESGEGALMSISQTEQKRADLVYTEDFSALQPSCSAATSG
jgi:hypothetical protein